MIIEALKLKGNVAAEHESRGIVYATHQKTPDSLATGYIAIDAGWCENEFKNEDFEELLKGQGLEYVMKDYNIKIYKTQSNRPLHKIKRHLVMIADKIKDRIEGREMAICKKK